LAFSSEKRRHVDQQRKQLLDEKKYDLCFGGARRDEEKSRAKERVFSIRAHRHHCNLQLWSGARLSERFTRIGGTGKQLRHVKIRSAAQLDDGIDDIIEAAIELDGIDPVRVR